MRFLLLSVFIFLFSCQRPIENFRTQLDLSGSWQFSLDSTDIGIQQKWFLTDLQDSVVLPGTMDENKKGMLNQDTTTMHLNRVFTYQGPAWYRKKVQIPMDFKDKHIQLIMERTKPSRVWIDDHLIGESILLQTPQFYDLTDYLAPGEHTITIQIDNNLKRTPYGNVHIYSDDTQTNWNGIIGNFMLEASSKSYISNLQVFPDIDKKAVQVKLTIENQLRLSNLEIELSVNLNVHGEITKLPTQKFEVPIDSVINLEYVLGSESKLWDEYEQPIYTLSAVMSSSKIKDSKSVTFGMRKFSVQGTQFNINGRTTLLRGKHDACVFPITGHPPMDVEGWASVYKIAKSYGINHYRFHSWCPPEAAFTAADQEGIYLQAELPFWGSLESDSVANMLKEEGIAMLKSYANHPSFVMFSHGNEIWSGHDKVEKNITAFKEYDDRPLYTMGSNNSIGYVGPGSSDFFVAARTPYDHDTVLTHTRLTQAFADSKDGAILNTQTPSTEVNFDYAVSQIKVPIISHEIGQYQIYPDYNEIDKYTGVLQAWNLEVFRKRLEQSGMLDQNMDFHLASGAWAALCYKAEMEAAIRTKGFAGFQLLDLQDFPGQGTALVGILDAFMDSKNVINPREWLHSCNDVVLLLEFPKYCWTNTENFEAKITVANYSNKELSNELKWEIANQNGEVLETDNFSNINIKTGGLTDLGEINFELKSIENAEKLNVKIWLEGSLYANTYPIWVYPKPNKEKMDQDILVAKKLNGSVMTQLINGKKVLFFPSTLDVKKNSVGGLFPPEFWNYGMFKGISEWAKKPVSPGTLGILTNPDHPIFNSFPTDSHTNWQWFSIVKASNPLILNQTQKEYRPIVQVVDNLERNDKLGLIFEFKVGDGKLLVCMSQLDEIKDNPEAAQLYKSILHYMDSEAFNPNYAIEQTELNKLIN